MESFEFKSDDFCMEVVSDESASIFSSFTCGNEVIDKYFQEKAILDPQNVCYIYRNKRNGDIVGLATLCCSGIIINDPRVVQLVPSIKIDYFAISVDYQDTRFPEADPDEHFNFSDAFFSELVLEAMRISETYVGASFIILYSVEKAVHFYERNKFSKFERYMKPEQYRYLDECVPMFLRLF